MTPAQYEQLRAVNRRVNALRFVDVENTAPFDEWLDAPTEGHSWVCRDYAITKAKLLREAGWPADALYVVLCWTEPGTDPTGPEGRGYHAVQAVQLQNEPAYILDSRWDDPYLMATPPMDYKWDRRQRPGTLDYVPVEM